MRTARDPGAQFPPSQWIKCISTQGSIRGIAIQATQLVRKMAEIHGIRGEASRSLGEAVMGALLIASYCKNGEKVNLNIRGSGNVMQALVDAYPNGAVRGYIVERQIAPVPADGVVFEDASRGPWGEGLLSVLRTKRQEHEQPYIGTVPLLTGHLAKDLTFYWVQSEQIPSAMGLAVNLDAEGVVNAAGGFMVQALPGASFQEVNAIERHIGAMHSLARGLATESDPLILLARIFESTAFMIIEETPLEFRCNCSWERVKRALTLVGATELRAMLAEDQGASVRCDFCGKKYDLDAAGLRELIAATTGG